MSLRQSYRIFPMQRGVIFSEDSKYGLIFDIRPNHELITEYNWNIDEDLFVLNSGFRLIRKNPNTFGKIPRITSIPSAFSYSRNPMDLLLKFINTPTKIETGTILFNAFKTANDDDKDH